LKFAKKETPKGCTKKARTGEIQNFSGFSDPYEVPEKPEMIIKTVDWTAEEAAVLIIEMLEKSGKIQAQQN
jgi:adenylylsulfate kinase-like enzyme